MGWTGRAHALNGSQSRMGLRRTRGARAMSRTTSAVAVSTIGIDTGKNTLHLIGLDERGTIVLREKLPRGRIGGRLANMPPCLIGIEASNLGGCEPPAGSVAECSGWRRGRHQLDR